MVSLIKGQNVGENSPFLYSTLHVAMSPFWLQHGESPSYVVKKCANHATHCVITSI